MCFTPVPTDRYPDGDDDAEWVRFTKRTDDPKLAWLQARLDEMGIVNRRNGDSWHAPILEVPASRLDEAWALLAPIDDVPDDDAQFADGYGFDPRYA